MSGLSGEIAKIEGIRGAADTAPVHCYRYIDTIGTLKDCDKVLATLIVAEIDDIVRFSWAKHFVPYSRLALTECFSYANQRAKAMPGTALSS